MTLSIQITQLIFWLSVTFLLSIFLHVVSERLLLHFYFFLFEKVLLFSSLSVMVDRKLKAAKGAFDISLDNGIDFFDTAEVYGSKVRRV